MCERLEQLDLRFFFHQKSPPETRPEVDFGVYGRFFLASLVKTKHHRKQFKFAAKKGMKKSQIVVDLCKRMQLRYVYIVDDDVAFPVGAIDFYLQQIRKQPGPRNIVE